MDEPKGATCVRLSSAMRLQWQRAEDVHVLLAPEGAVQLNRNAAVILGLCDGHHSANDIAQELAHRFGGDTLAGDVHEFLDAARGHGWIVDA